MTRSRLCVRHSRRTNTRRSSTRLLASPHYGERWARYWLDVVRYARRQPGNITNPPYPYAWRYRDWVIESFNKDVPYDRFVKLQLAADLMPVTSRSDLRALGIIALGPQDHKDVRLSVDVVGTIQLNDWDERLDAVSRGLLGLSVACARCHDHKFDPIRQKDYYRLAERVRVDPARVAAVLRHRSEDGNPLHVGLPADVRSSLHGQPSRKRSRVEAGAGGPSGEEVPRRSWPSCRPKSTRCRRSIRSSPPISKRSRIRERRRRLPPGAKTAEPAPAEKKDRAPGSDSEHRAGSERGCAAAGRGSGSIRRRRS